MSMLHLDAKRGKQEYRKRGDSKSTINVHGPDSRPHPVQVITLTDRIHCEKLSELETCMARATYLILFQQ